MKKVLLLALESDARNALEELRNAGVMQINAAGQSSNDTMLIAENRSRAEQILAELEKFDVEADPASKLTLPLKNAPPLKVTAKNSAAVWDASLPGVSSAAG